jgi:hypothetical protein
MHKYALVIAASRKYLPGVNALLNALDYYDNPVDIKYLIFNEEQRKVTDPLTAEFLKKLPTAGFNFDVEVIKIDDFLKDKPFKNTRAWKCKFSGWKLAGMLANKYAAVAHWPADCLILDNVMAWFEIAEKTDYIVLGFNAKGNYHWQWQPVRQGTSGCPYTAVPWFYDPAKHADVTDRAYELGLEHQIGDLTAMNYAIHELKPKVLPLPDILWIRNDFFHVDGLGMDAGGDNRYLISQKTHMRLSAVHGRWWSKKTMNGYINKAEIRSGEVLRKQTAYVLGLCHQMYKFFNTQHKLKLDWEVCSV